MMCPWNYSANAKSRASTFTNIARYASFRGYRNSPKKVDIPQRGHIVAVGGFHVVTMKKFARIVYAVIVLACLVNCVWLYTTGRQVESVMNLVLAHMFMTLDLLYKPNAAPEDGISLTFYLPGKVQKHLARVMKAVGADNMITLFREALTVYDVLVTAVTESKARIFVEYPDGKRAEFEMLSPKLDDKKPSVETPVSPDSEKSDVSDNLEPKTQIR